MKLHQIPMSRQRGAAALIVTLMLLFAMALLAAFTNRNLVFEQRASANQYRSTQAFEAAEAGIEWALAQLDTHQRIGDDCEPSADPATASFRTRMLSIAHDTGTIVPTGLQAACVQSANGWSCSCPAHGSPSLAAPSGTAPAAAFLVRWMPADKPGVVRIAVDGCTRLAGACLVASTDRPDASARIEIAVGLVPGLRTPPASTVTIRGSFDVGSATLGLHNADAATGVAVNAGGAIDAPQARLTPPAGEPVTGLLVGHDTALAALGADRFFATYFGLDKAAWKSQPAVARIACTSDCASVLDAAIASAPDGALIHVAGDLALAGPLALGSAERPVVIVVDGAVRFTGGVAFTGVLYAASIEWNQAIGGAFARGALLSEGDYRGDGTPDLFYDAAVLDTLTHATGSFARVAGSWRDF